MFALPKWLTDIKALLGSANGKFLGRSAGGAWVFSTIPTPGLIPVAVQTLGANASIVTFSGLDSSTDGDYVLTGAFKGSSGTEPGVRLFINGDTTDANYRSSLVFNTGTTLGVYSSSTAQLCDLRPAGKATLIDSKISCIFGIPVSNGQVSAIDSADVLTGYKFDWRKLATVSSITSITLSAGALSFLAGSSFKLYKTGVV